MGNKMVLSLISIFESMVKLCNIFNIDKHIVRQTNMTKPVLPNS